MKNWEVEFNPITGILNLIGIILIIIAISQHSYSIGGLGIGFMGIDIKASLRKK